LAIIPQIVLIVGLGCTAGCKSPDAALLTVSGDAPAAYYDLYVRDDLTQDTVFHSGFSLVAKDTPTDITKSDQPLKIALSLDGGGGREFTFLLVGALDTMPAGSVPDPDKQMFWAGRSKISGTARINARLLKVDPGFDADRDLWPDATKWPAAKPEAQTLYAATPFLLDCADVPMPALPTFLMPNQINPFAKERCADMFDTDCNGSIVMCGDVDKDGDPSDTDCDDNDPKRHHANAMDPYPDPPNCCGYSLGKTGTEKAINYFYDAGDPNCKAASCVRDAMLCPSQRCGNGVDDSCSNKDTECATDNDCDGVVAGKDCDDNDPTVYPGAPETCADTKDKNCDGKVGTGCVPCDLDGDGFLRDDVMNNCKPVAGMIDCNDYDSSIHPGSTGEKTPVTGATNLGSGKEGGTSLTSAVIAALRGTCRRYYDIGSMHGKIAAPVPKGGGTVGIVGDADCNGVAYEGCPSTTCDADGDGYPNSGAGCAIAGVATDCDDTNPTIFPNAPDKCGDGIISNCGATDTVCPGASVDKDGDGYFGTFDCDDTDPNTHPFALELCDVKDNDCDGLIDEGNPDELGEPLLNAAGTGIYDCTTSSVGDCANNHGTCVCSQLTTNAHYDSNRIKCRTEVEADAGKGQPECFGSTQPLAFQSCDPSKAPHDDNCDGSNDDLTGAKTKEFGMPCGPTVANSTCSPGTIVGCHAAVNNCFAPLSASDPAKAWYICSSTAVCPKPEICNGLDDDCNGSVPGNEADGDLDKFLACSPVVPPLKAGLLGGGDCDDGNGSVFPGQVEKCNNISDNCGLNADGSAYGGTDGMGSKGECSMLGTTCCSTQPACRNLTNDFNNCSGCNVGCNALYADSCGSSSCKCGGGAACTPGTGQWCKGSCTACNDATHCGPNCVTCSGSTSKCKSDNSGCVACNNDGDCTSAQYCNGSNQCVTRIAGGAICTSSNQCVTTSPNCTMTAAGTKVCCDQATCGVCLTCSTGTCASTAAGTQPGCSGTNSCDGNGNCKKGQGQSCAGSSECANNQCLDLVCCGSASCGACTNCAAGTGLCTVSVTSGPDNTGTTCNGTSTCNAAGACKNANGSTCTLANQCASNICSSRCCAASCPGASCSDAGDPSVATSATTCDNTGACNSNATNNCGTGFSCNGNACNTSCTGSTTGNGCKPGYRCNGGSCLQCGNNVNNACGTATCTDCAGQTNNKVCRTATCGCDADSDCSGTKFCASTHLCVDRGATGSACVTNNCADGMNTCLQCQKGGGQACPAGLMCP